MIRFPKVVIVPNAPDAIAFVVSLCIHLTAAIALAFCLVMGGGEGEGSLLVSLASESSTAPELTSVVIENHAEIEPSSEPTEDFVPELNKSLSLDAVTPKITLWTSTIKGEHPTHAFNATTGSSSVACSTMRMLSARHTLQPAIMRGWSNRTIQRTHLNCIVAWMTRRTKPTF